MTAVVMADQARPTLWSMQAGLKNAYESIKAFSETDFTEDLKKIYVPALVLHGEDDQIVPVMDFGKKVGKAYKRGKGDLLPRSAARSNGYPSGSGQLSPSGISSLLKGGRRFREADSPI